MNVVIINKSDLTGGAAVVSFRLMQALREKGVEASMLVTEKLSDSPYVHLASNKTAMLVPFLWERLKIFLTRGVNLKNLFKIDTASDGLPLHRHPLVKNADIVCLNWVNQGLLSLKGVEKILKLGKPVVWTMHDMWNFTGVCHHAGSCLHYLGECGNCPILGSGASLHDLSFKIHNKKMKTYGRSSGNGCGLGPLHFVAVSGWLRRLAKKSTLLGKMPLSVIPNAFPIPDKSKVAGSDNRDTDKFTLVFGAARLDDPIKGLPILIEVTKILKEEYPEESKDMELVTFGNVKKVGAIDGIALPHRHLGLIRGEEAVRKIYASGNVVLSTSLYETLPGTLVEGQVYGCIPVAFGRGGQTDIIDHKITGYVAEWDDDKERAARHIVEGILWAKSQNHKEIKEKMFDSASGRFDAPVVADKYIQLFESLLG